MLFGSKKKSPTPNQLENNPVLDALKSSMLVAEFLPDGQLRDSSHAFSNLIGSNQLGRATDIFSAHDQSPGFNWQQVASGHAQSGLFNTQTSSGQNATVSGAFTPLRSESGAVEKIVFVGSLINQNASSQSDTQSIIDAVDRSTAMIEFNLDGTVINVNKNFLAATGYDLGAIQGQHHRMFCTSEYAESKEYQNFWNDLRSGRFIRGKFERKNRAGQTLWLEASYNPVMDASGRVCKVIKLATDITEAVEKDLQDSNSAAKAYTIVSETERTAEEGTGIIQNAAKEMQRIAETVTASAGTISDLGKQSEQITAIVNTIRGIADQTNLLALNAAIEAARAGDQGRGFAVVADEVRQLAGRTSQSTQEISEMIEKIQSGTESSIQQMNTCQDQAQRGVELANRAGDAILQIREGAHQAVEAVSVFSDKVRNHA